MSKAQKALTGFGAVSLVCGAAGAFVAMRLVQIVAQTAGGLHQVGVPSMSAWLGVVGGSLALVAGAVLFAGLVMRKVA